MCDKEFWHVLLKGAVEGCCCKVLLQSAVAGCRGRLVCRLIGFRSCYLGPMLLVWVFG